MSTKKSKSKQLGQILIEKELITPEQLEKALEVQIKEGGLLGQLLVKLGFVTQQQIEDSIFEQTSAVQQLENVLMEMGVLTPEQLKQAQDAHKKDGGIIEQIFVKLGFFGEEDLVSILVTQYGFPYLQLENYEIDPEIVKSVPRDIAEKHALIAIDKIGNILTIAMANPLNAAAQDAVRKKTGLNVESFISTFSEITKSISRYYT